MIKRYLDLTHLPKIIKFVYLNLTLMGKKFIIYLYHWVNKLKNYIYPYLRIYQKIYIPTQHWIKLQEHRKHRLSYFSTMVILCSQPIKEEINFEFLNLRFNIKASTFFWNFFSSYLVKKERKELMTPHTSLFMFFARLPISISRIIHHYSKHAK